MIPDPVNNGTLPPAHIAQREAGRQQRQADARLIATPIQPTSDPLSLFVRVVLLFVLLLVLALLASPAGAAERPVAESVEITTVKGDAGFYAIALADGRIAMVLPVSIRTPALQAGAATFYPTTMELRQGKHAYTVRWIRKAVTK